MLRRLAIGSLCSMVLFGTELPASTFLTWEDTGGPQGAVVASLATTSLGTLLLGTDSGGLYRSVDAGQTWDAVDLSWPCCNYGIPALAASARTVYAGTWGGGVHRSDDDGQTWYGTGAIPGEGYPIVLALAVCRYGETVYAAGQFGVARSDDGGAGWVLVNDGLPSSWVRTLALRGTVLYARLDQDLYRLDPVSGTWSEWEEGLASTFAMQSISATGDGLFLATHEGGVFHLGCDDSAWVPMNDGLYDDNVDAVVEVDQTLYAGLMGGGVRRWDPAASWWDEVSSGLWNRDVRVMGKVGLSPLAGTWGAGVFLLDPDTQEWAARDSGVRSPLVTSLMADGTDVYCGVEGAGIFKSEDQGDTWVHAVDGLDNMWVFNLARESGGIYAGTWNGVWKSADDGVSWAAAGLQGNGIFALEFFPDALYAGTFTGTVQSSTDGGQTWQPVGSGLPAGTVMGVARLDAALYAVVNSYGAYTLPDGQTGWTAMNAGLPALDFGCLATDGAQLYLGTADNGVYRWNPATQQWDAAGLAGNLIFCLESAGGQLLAGTYGDLWASPDGGLNWTSEHAGLKDWLPVRAICVGRENLFAGLGGGGVWRTPNASAVPDPAGETLPVPLSPALTVRPNPFARGTQVAFSLDRRQVVDLAVFDVAGRRVASLAAGELGAGSHQRTWDGTTDGGGPAAAGVYIIRLQAGGTELSTKTIHVR